MTKPEYIQLTLTYPDGTVLDFDMEDEIDQDRAERAREIETGLPRRPGTRRPYDA